MFFVEKPIILDKCLETTGNRKNRLFSLMVFWKLNAKTKFRNNRTCMWQFHHHFTFLKYEHIFSHSIKNLFISSQFFLGSHEITTSYSLNGFPFPSFDYCWRNYCQSNFSFRLLFRLRNDENGILVQELLRNEILRLSG